MAKFGTTIMFVLGVTLALTKFSSAREMPSDKGLSDQMNVVTFGGLGGISGIGSNGIPFGGVGGGVGAGSNIGGIGGLGGVGGFIGGGGLGGLGGSSGAGDLPTVGGGYGAVPACP